MTTTADHDVTRDEIAEALTHMAHTAAGIPDYCRGRRERVHAEMDALLQAWQAAA